MEIFGNPNVFSVRQELCFNLGYVLEDVGLTKCTSIEPVSVWGDSTESVKTVSKLNRKNVDQIKFGVMSKINVCAQRASLTSTMNADNAPKGLMWQRMENHASVPQWTKSTMINQTHAKTDVSITKDGTTTDANALLIIGIGIKDADFVLLMLLLALTNLSAFVTVIELIMILRLILAFSVLLGLYLIGPRVLVFVLKD